MSTYLVSATFSGWTEPRPDREDWYEAASELAGDPERLRRTAAVLYDESGKMLEEWSGDTPKKPDDRQLLLCEWDTVWEVHTEGDSLGLKDLFWSLGLVPTVDGRRGDCLEEDGPSWQLL